VRRSLPARAYRRFVPGPVKVRLAPMILRYRRHREARRTAARSPDEAWTGQRRALLGGDPGLRHLAYFPAGVQNPYLRLLYARIPEEGFDANPLGRYELLDRLPESSVFHLHWTRVFQVGTASEAEAVRQTKAYLGRIEDFLGRGGNLLWSVHEWLPHDCEFPGVEVELRKRLVELATGVHVLHGSTVEEVSGLYPLDPARTFTVEHPLYAGVYADYVSRESARRLIGVADDEILLLGFGAIRPYKGFDRLVRLVPRLREQTGLPIRVVLAGPTLKSIDINPLRDLVEATPGVSMTDRAVPDEFVHVVFKAADVAVLPYRQVLNSGVLMLALTFGCPSVAPDNPVTRDTVGSGLVHLFDRESDEDLLRAVTEAIDRRGERGSLPDEFEERFGHAAIAGQFARELKSRIGEVARPGMQTSADPEAS